MLRGTLTEKLSRLRRDVWVGNGHGPRSSSPMRRKRTPYRWSTSSIATSVLIYLKLTQVVAITHCSLQGALPIVMAYHDYSRSPYHPSH
jgi:hypothetical protein